MCTILIASSCDFSIDVCQAFNISNDARVHYLCGHFNAVLVQFRMRDARNCIGVPLRVVEDCNKGEGSVQSPAAHYLWTGERFLLKTSLFTFFSQSNKEVCVL